jgi:hypothetical protein
MDEQIYGVYRNADGVELEARDEVQAAAMENNGFTAVEPKKGRKTKTEE